MKSFLTKRFLLLYYMNFFFGFIKITILTISMQFSLDFSILDPHSALEGEFDCGSTLHSPGPKAPKNSSPNSYGYT